MAWNRSILTCWAVAMLMVGLIFASWAGLIAAQEGEAQVRVMHAGWDIGPVDIYIDGNLTFEAVEYSDATGYVVLPAGEYDVQVTAAGEDPARALIDTVLVLDRDTPHTMVAIGPADRADVIVIIDDHTAPPAGIAKLSLVNASSDGISMELATAGGKVLVEDVPFADASEYLELEAGAYDFTIRSVESGDEVASISGFNAEPGMTYSIFAIGVDGEYQVTAFVDASDSGQAPAATPTAGASTQTSVAVTPVPADSMPTIPAETPSPASATSTPVIVATPSPVTQMVMATLPNTGGGGAAKGGGMSGWLLVVVAVVVLLGAAVGRFGHMPLRGRS